MSKTDHSGKVGGRRNATGNDTTAGNSTSRPGRVRTFGGSRASAALGESKRTRNSQIRKGRKDARN